ncbi:FAD-dependent oxidoreductase, partial [Bacteroides heparinolyticus]
MNRDTVVIGAGITGLTCAFRLKEKGADVAVLERLDRVGGQIHTVREEGFVFESGPNTGVIKYPEV